MRLCARNRASVEQSRARHARMHARTRTHARTQEARQYFDVQEVPFRLEEAKDGPGPHAEAAAPPRACADVHIFELRLLPSQRSSQGE